MKAEGGNRVRRWREQRLLLDCVESGRVFIDGLGRETVTRLA